MKKLILTLILLFFINITLFGQSNTRKIRSDKGKTHNHTTNYYNKSAVVRKKKK
jgi:hypothetical protein